MMAIKEKWTSTKENSGIDLMPVAIVSVLSELNTTFYIAYLASISSKMLFPVKLIAIFAILLFETTRAADSGKSLFNK